MRDYLARNVVPYLRHLRGVAGVGLYGSTDYAMRIWLSAPKMVARGVTVPDIKTAITSNNIYFPAGSFRGPPRNYSIVSDTRLKNVMEFGNIIVKNTPEGVVRLKDVATVKLGMRGFEDLPMLINGKQGLTIQVSALQSANPITVAKEVRQEFYKLQKRLPKTMQSFVLYDFSGFLQQSIIEAFNSIGEAVVLVVLVVIFFLGSIRSSLIPIVTIPISLISVFFVIKLLGFSINIMTLLAMVLAIGLVVDDAIVMLENIHRHIEEGLSPLRAAYIGSKEIAFPIVVMALTLVAVYAPVGFVQGVTAALFQQFAFTLASAVLISGFIALTLSPMMCSRILQPQTEEGLFLRFVNHFFDTAAQGYQRLLKFMLKIRWIVVLVCLVIAAIGYGIYSNINSAFLPKEDGGYFVVSVRAPSGSSLAYTEKYVKQVVKIIDKVPEVQKTLFQMSTNYVGVRCFLKPWDQRTRTPQQIAAALNPELSKIPGVTAVASAPDPVTFGQGGSDVEINFMTTHDYEDLMPSISKMVSILKKYPGEINVDSGLKFDSQQYSITINRDLASSLGVNLQDIADTVQAMISGIHWTDIQSGTRSYAVMLQMEKQALENFDSIGKLYVPVTPAVPPTDGKIPMVPLSSLVTLTPKVGQGTLTHFNRLRSGRVTATLAPGYTESQVINFVKQQLPKVLTPKVQFSFSGKMAQFLNSSGSMAGILVLSFVFIYLVLAAQFGSFVDPFIILLAVPLSLVGALFSLWISGGTFTLYSQIGLVTLVGLISKHGILITKFINDLRENGVAFHQAIIQGATVRFRPVLMTTMAMIFGTLPLALATGPESVGRQQIGWTLVGGLFFGTFFSLVVVPVAYSFLGNLIKKRIITDAELKGDDAV